VIFELKDSSINEILFGPRDGRGITILTISGTTRQRVVKYEIYNIEDIFHLRLLFGLQLQVEQAPEKWD